MAALKGTLKVILVAVLAVLMLVVVTLGAVKMTDWSEHKALLILIVETLTNWEVERLGAVQVELYFPTRISADEVSLTQEPPAALSSISADHFEISLDPLSSFLQDRLTIYDLQALNARIVAQQTPEKGKKELTDSNPIPFIDSVHITDARILYQRQLDRLEDLAAHVARLEIAPEGKGESVSVVGRGTVADMPVSFDATLGSLKNLSTEGRPFPFDLEGSIAGDTISLEGRVATEGPDDTLNVDFAAEGDSLTEIARAFGISLSDVPPYKVSISAGETKRRITLTDIQLTLGYSYVYGEASLQMDGPKPYLRADLGASELHLEDFASLLPENDADGESTSEQHLFPREPLKLDFLHKLDARVEIAIADYKGGDAGQLVNGLTLEAKLEDGKLVVNPFEFSLAGGTLGGGLLLDDGAESTAVKADLAAKRINLTDLLSPYLDIGDPGKAIRGTLSANLELLTSGNTAHEWASRLDGDFSLAIQDGAVTALLTEALGLDVTEAALAWFTASPLTEIQCAIGIFNIDSGVIRTKALLLATQDANIVGRGTLNLGEETIDMTLESHARDFSIPASDSPIHLTGSLTDIQVDVVSGELVMTLGTAAVLAVINPLLAALPLLELGFAEGDRCGDLERELQRIQRRSRQQLALE